MRNSGRLFAAACGAALALVSVVPSGAQDAGTLLEEYSTQITVYGERLPLHDLRVLDAPAPVTVVSREEIESSGARTVQQILERLPGVSLHDQTGNPVDATVGLRGFPQGTSAAVFLDGVRLNGLEDNAVPWASIPLEEVERIEVVRGSAAPLYGGGALAGVVNIVTRREAGIPRVDLSAAAGSFGDREGRLHAHGTLGPVDLYLTALKRRSDGYRENDGHDLDDGLARFAWRPAGGYEVALLLAYHGGKIQQPGALTAAEMAEDRRQSPFNLHDGTRGTQRVAALSYAFDGGEHLRVSAQAFTRDTSRDTLSAGRWGMGFESSYRESYGGVAAEAHGAVESSGWTLSYGGGVEANWGSTGARGFYTDAAGEHPVPASSTGTRVSPAGLFAQLALAKGPWELSAGYRADESEYRYRDHFVPSGGVERTFREEAGRASLVYHPTEDSTVFVTRAEGYRIPSVIDLFAYPGFYSNPDLVPSRSVDWEVGGRLVRRGLRVQVTAFRMRTVDEVVFVLVDPAHFIGQNRNAGSSLREGLEAEGSAGLGRGFTLMGSATFLNAEITDGPHAGVPVPMVPEKTASAALRWANRSWRAEISGTWVGEQPLDGDLSGTRPMIAGYFRLDAALEYRRGSLTLEASASNLLNRCYTPRGITNGFEDYFTPARPRALRIGAAWSF